MFTAARKAAPSIIFIDEVDAIGQRRGGCVGVERRAGADAQSDARRDGRLRRDVRCRGARGDEPARDARSRCCARAGSIVRSRSRCRISESAPRSSACTPGKHLGDDVDLDVVARSTPGFSGADLANLVNEAAIVAVRRTRHDLGGGLLRSARPHPARPARGDQRAHARREARGRGARVGSRAGRGAVAGCRSGGEGDDPARRSGAGRDRAASVG